MQLLKAYSHELTQEAEAAMIAGPNHLTPLLMGTAGARPVFQLCCASQGHRAATKPWLSCWVSFWTCHTSVCSSTLGLQAGVEPHLQLKAGFQGVANTLSRADASSVGPPVTALGVSS